MRGNAISGKEFHYIIIVVLVSALTFRAVYMMHGDWQELAKAAIGITEGRPHWRAFQNRLLGPYLVLGINFIVPSYTASLQFFTAIGILVQNILMYRLLRLQNIEQINSVILTIIWSFFFVVIQDYWIYTWDMFDVILFTSISYIVLFSKNKIIMLYLFPISLLNRESALFIPAIYGMYLLAEAYFRRKKQISIALYDAGLRIALCLVLMFVGVCYTKFIRDQLFIERSLTDIAEPETVMGNHIHFIWNIFRFFVVNLFSIHIIHTMLIWFSIIYMVRTYLHTEIVATKVAVMLFFLILASIMIFGLVNETRMYFPLISLTLLIYVARQKELGEERGPKQA